LEKESKLRKKVNKTCDRQIKEGAPCPLCRKKWELGGRGHSKKKRGRIENAKRYRGCPDKSGGGGRERGLGGEGERTEGREGNSGVETAQKNPRKKKVWQLPNPRSRMKIWIGFGGGNPGEQKDRFINKAGFLV